MDSILQNVIIRPTSIRFILKSTEKKADVGCYALKTSHSATEQVENKKKADDLRKETKNLPR